MVDDPIHLIPFPFYLFYTPSSTSQYQSNNTSSIDVDQKAISEKLSAWHSLVDPDVENVRGGVGSGQLHRSGRNYIPVSEQEVLEIQRKNKKWGGGKSMFSVFSLNNRKIETMGNEAVRRMVQREEHNHSLLTAMEIFAKLILFVGSSQFHKYGS